MICAAANSGDPLAPRWNKPSTARYVEQKLNQCDGEARVKGKRIGADAEPSRPAPETSVRDRARDPPGAQHREKLREERVRKERLENRSRPRRRRTVARETHGSLRKSTQEPLRKSVQEPLRKSAAAELSRTLHGADRRVNETQGEGLRKSLRTGRVPPRKSAALRKSMQEPLRRSAAQMHASQNANPQESLRRSPLRRSTQEPLRNSTLEPLPESTAQGTHAAAELLRAVQRDVNEERAEGEGPRKSLVEDLRRSLLEASTTSQVHRAAVELSRALRDADRQLNKEQAEGEGLGKSQEDDLRKGQDEAPRKSRGSSRPKRAKVAAAQEPQERSLDPEPQRTVPDVHDQEIPGAQRAYDLLRNPADEDDATNETTKNGAATHPESLPSQRSLQFKILRTLPGYALGDPLRMTDRFLFPPDDDGEVMRFSFEKLREGDCAFVRRSDGSLTYAQYKGPGAGDDPSKRSFLLDDEGHYKVVDGKGFAAIVRVPVLAGRPAGEGGATGPRTAALRLQRGRGLSASMPPAKPPANIWARGGGPPARRASAASSTFSC